MKSEEYYINYCKIVIDFLVYKVLYYMSTFLGISLPFGLRVEMCIRDRNTGEAFNLFNAFTGGSFEQMSIFALSITCLLYTSIVKGGFIHG